MFYYLWANYTLADGRNQVVQYLAVPRHSPTHCTDWMVDERLLHLVSRGDAVDAMCRKAHKTYINLT